MRMVLPQMNVWISEGFLRKAPLTGSCGRSRPAPLKSPIRSWGVDRSGADRAKFYVVGNGRDPTPYLRDWPQRTDNEFRLCYAGSLGGKYYIDQMIEVAKGLRAHIPNLVFCIFTSDKTNLDVALDRSGVTERHWIQVSRLPPEEMPAALIQCDLALALFQRPPFRCNSFYQSSLENTCWRVCR